jgi:LysM repeat protein
MKTPKFLSKLSAVLTPRPKKRLQATVRAARPAMDDYDSEEPTTKLSSAFIVVLILHVVAVGGIYAFNSIKASRRDRETAMAAAAPVAPATVKSASAKVESASAPAHSPVPAATVRSAEAPAPVPAPAANKPATADHYTIKAGDNLTKIAFAYKVTAADLMEANHLKDGAKLQPGQLLIIPVPKAGPKPAVAETHKAAEATPRQADVPPTKTTPGFYTVKKGDTPTSIARSFGLTAEELLRVNKITDPKKLQLGQTLKVPPRKS